MLRDFLLSFNLKNTYRVNTIIYTLKNTPLIKKILPYSLYTNKGLKAFANVVSVLIEIFNTFVWKFLYLLIFCILTVPYFKNSQIALINIFVFLTIIGGLLNTYIFDPSTDKYYAIFLMNFDAKKYTLSNYIYSLFKCLIGVIPWIILTGLISKLSLITCLLLSIFVINIKNIFNAYNLYKYKQKRKIKNENKYNYLSLIFSSIFLLFAYGLPYFNCGISINVFYIIFILSTIIGIISFNYIIKYDFYTQLCKEMIKKEKINNNVDIEDLNYKKQIMNNKIKNTNKEGYAYFNYVFKTRNKKLLTNATKNISIGSVIIFAIIITICLLFPTKKEELNSILKNSLSYFLFILYFLNRGQKICQTMFMNCDRSMLTYRFYREKIQFYHYSKKD